MALQWDLTKCENAEELRSDKEWPVTDAIIWYTMFTNTGWEITEDNAAEFYARIHFFEKVFGTALSHAGEDVGSVDRFITPEDVHKRIGLKVNVGPMVRRTWIAQKTKRFFEGAIRDYNKATAKEEVIS